MFSEPVYKVFRRFEWDGFQASGRFAGSADDQRDGFIHLSTRTQLEGVLSRFFRGEDEVIIATVLFDEIAALKLKWEKSTGGDFFPHYYGELQGIHIHSHVPALPGPDGQIAAPGDVFFTQSVL